MTKNLVQVNNLHKDFSDHITLLIDFAQKTHCFDGGFFNWQNIGFKVVYRMSNFIDSIQKDNDRFIQDKIAVLCPNPDNTTHAILLSQ